mgnify:CR=1 FL=1
MVFFILVSFLSLILALGSFLIERYIFKNAPFLENITTQKTIETSLTIVIPAYNEEKNITNCLKALSKIKRPSDDFKNLKCRLNSVPSVRIWI